MSSTLRLSSAPKLNLKSATALEKSSDFEDTVPLQKQLEDAYNKGFSEGQQKLRRDLDKDYSDKLYKKYEEVYHLFEAYDQRLKEYEQTYERLAIGTAVELARKIIQREIKEVTIINQVVKDAIAKVVGANEVRIKFNPSDLAQLNNYSRNLINSSSFNKIKFEEDEKIESGGCLIETEIGNVDARISTQLEELRRKLDESIESE